MSALLLDEKTAKERLSSKDNLAVRFNGGQPLVEHIETQNKKGPFGYAKIPDFLKVAIGIDAQMGAASQRQIAKDYEVSLGTVNNLATGKPLTVGNNGPAIEKGLADVKDVALERLMTSLGLIDNDKLANTNALGLSNIARNLATIVEKTSPDTGNKGVTQLLVYCPQQRREDLYASIDV